MREGAQYFRFPRRERENRGLLGGEGRIRTLETLGNSRGGIQPEFGALFGFEKGILAGENLFALNSALLRISSALSLPELTRGIW
jgi:hypothetical protein